MYIPKIFSSGFVGEEGIDQWNSLNLFPEDVWIFFHSANKQVLVEPLTSRFVHQITQVVDSMHQRGLLLGLQEAASAKAQIFTLNAAQDSIQLLDFAFVELCEDEEHMQAELAFLQGSFPAEVDTGSSFVASTTGY